MANEHKMEYGFLGTECGLKVSKICLGAMTFGKSEDSLFKMPGNITESESHEVMDKFYERGGNFIDTANVYQAGESERIVGSWMKKANNRDAIVLATKCCFFVSTKHIGPNEKFLSRKNIVHAVEASLERLQTNYIDLYQVHSFDRGTPQRETLMTLNDLVRCGKVRYIGASNFNGWQLMEALDICEQMGLDKYVSLQNQYNLLCRDCELDVFEVCKRKGVGVIPWSPLKGGLLSEKAAQRNASLPEDCRQHYAAKMPAEMKKRVFRYTYDQIQDNDDYWKMVDVLKTTGAKHDKTVSQVSLRWLLQKRPVTSVIIGARSLRQLEENMVAGQSDWKLTDHEIAELDQASEFALHETYPYSMQKVNIKDRENF